MVFGRKSGVEADASWTTERSIDARKTLRMGFPPLPQPNILPRRKCVNNVFSIHTASPWSH